MFGFLKSKLWLLLIGFTQLANLNMKLAPVTKLITCEKNWKIARNAPQLVWKYFNYLKG